MKSEEFYKRFMFIPIILIIIILCIIGNKIINKYDINDNVVAVDEKRELPETPVEIPEGFKIININTADEYTLETLPEIGETLAKKIVEKRTEMNGFRDIYDLTNVDGISRAVVTYISNLITVDETETREEPENSNLININTASLNELMTIDGLDKGKAKLIIEDREKNGPYKSTRDIVRVNGIGNKTYLKIKDKITY
ncbi:MAG: ComEA family DNA-binding protein [Clostridia bacterium]|nr:ComEA family DNA-binding protein [Clostridia bacterium]